MYAGGVWLAGVEIFEKIVGESGILGIFVLLKKNEDGLYLGLRGGTSLVLFLRLYALRLHYLHKYFCLCRPSNWN